MTSQITRLRLGLATGTAAALATAAVLAASGSAQAPPSSLHFVSKTQTHDGARHRPCHGHQPETSEVTLNLLP